MNIEGLGVSKGSIGFFFLWALFSLLVSTTNGEHEIPVMVELRSPELGNSFIEPRERQIESSIAADEPVQVSSVKITGSGLSNFWSRNFKKPLNNNWRDHYIRSSRMGPQNDDSQFDPREIETPMVLEGESELGPILLSLEPVGFRQNSAQRNHYLRTKKKTVIVPSKPKANNIQSHYLRSSRSVNEGSSSKKRQTTERDHYLRTVRSSNSQNSQKRQNNQNSQNNSSNENSSNRKARDHYFRKLNFFRTVKRNAEDDSEEQKEQEVEQPSLKSSFDRKISSFKDCMRTAIENDEP